MLLPDDLVRHTLMFHVKFLRELFDLYTVSKRFRAVLSKPLMVTHLQIATSHLSHLGVLSAGVRTLVFDTIDSPPLPPTVTTLHLRRCEVDVPDLFGHLPNSTDLNVSSCNLLQFGPLTAVPLKTLKVEYHDFTDLGMVHRFPNLHTLHLKDAAYVPLCDTLSTVAHWPKLHTLVLAGSYLDDALVQGLQPLAQTLKRLSLAFTPVGDPGAAVLLQFRHLDTLSLGYCSLLTEKTMHVLSHLHNLENLYISNCDMVTNESLSCLCGLDRLEILDISTHVPKNLDLQPLHDLTNLRVLNLGVHRYHMRNVPNVYISDTDFSVYLET